MKADKLFVLACCMLFSVVSVAQQSIVTESRNRLEKCFAEGIDTPSEAIEALGQMKRLENASSRVDRFSYLSLRDEYGNYGEYFSGRIENLFYSLFMRDMYGSEYALPDIDDVLVMEYDKVSSEADASGLLEAFNDLFNYYIIDGYRAVSLKEAVLSAIYWNDHDAGHRKRILDEMIAVVPDGSYACVKYRLLRNELEYSGDPESELEEVNRMLYEYGHEPEILPVAFKRILLESRIAYSSSPVNGNLLESISVFSESVLEEFAYCSDDAVYKSDYRMIFTHLESMKARRVKMTAESSVFYPGQNVRLSLSVVNADTVNASVYRLPDACRFRSLDCNADSIAFYASKFEKVLDLEVHFENMKIAVERDTVISCQMDETGEYIVVASGGTDYLPMHRFIVTNVFFATRASEDGASIYVTDMKTGTPLSSASVMFYKRDFDGNTTFYTPVGTKDLSLCGFEDFVSGYDNNLYANVIAGGDSTSPVLPVRTLRSGGRTEKARMMSVLFSDRKLYMPGDTALLKVILFNQDPSGVRKTLQGEKLTLKIYSPGGKLEDETLLETNGFGSASYGFECRGARMGSYVAEVRRGDEYLTSASFRIEDYHIPALRIELDRKDDLYTYGDTVHVSGRLVSDAGFSVEGREISVEVSSGNVPELTVGTDENGCFEISFPVGERPENAAAPLVKIPGFIRISLRSLSPDGELVTAVKHISVCAEPLLLSCDIPDVLLKGMENRFFPEVSGVNSGHVDADINYRIVTYDGLHTVISGTVSDGESICTDAIQSPGRYVLELSAEKSGKKAVFRKPFHYVDPYADTLPEGMDTVMFVSGLPSTDEMIRAVAGTSERKMSMLAEILYYEKVLYSKVVELDDGMRILEIPYASEWPDNVQLSVFAVREGKPFHTLMDYGRKKDNPFIKMELVEKPDSIRSGEKSSLKLRVTDRYGNPVSAELAVSAYNRSLDRFGENSFHLSAYRTPVPYAPYITCSSVSYYPAISLARSNTLYASGAAPAAVMEAKLAISDNDAVAEDSAAGSSVMNENGTRSNFSESALKVMHLVTDADGEAELTVKGGDLLSEYRIIAFAHTADVLTAGADCIYSVYKNISVRAGIPKFLREGDSLSVEVGAFMKNAAWSKTDCVDAVVYLKAEDSVGKKIFSQERRLSIRQGEEVSEVFSIMIPHGTVENIRYEYGVVAGNERDAVTGIIDILPSEEEQFVSHAYLVDGKSTMEIPYPDDARSFDIKVISPVELARSTSYTLSERESPTFTTALCRYVSEMILASLAGTDPAAKAPGKPAGMDKLLEFANADGGFPWISGMRSSFDMTLSFAEQMKYLERKGMLVLADKAGDAFDRAMGYLDRSFASMDSAYVVSLPENVLRYASLRNISGVKSGNAALSSRFALLSSKIRSFADYHAASVRKMAYVADVAGKLGMYGKRDSVLDVLRDYAVLRDGYVIFPNASMADGNFDAEMDAHLLLYSLFAGSGDMDTASGIYRWVMMQRSMYDWGTSMTTLKAVEMILSESYKIRKKPSFTVCGLVASAENGVWEKKGIQSGDGGMLFRNRSASPLVVMISTCRTVPVEDLDPDFNGASVTYERKYDDSFVSVKYRVSSPLFMDYMVMEGISTPELRPVVEKSGLMYMWGVQCYREVRSDGIRYYFETLPRGVYEFDEHLYRAVGGKFSVRNVKLYRE